MNMTADLIVHFLPPSLRYGDLLVRNPMDLAGDCLYERSLLPRRRRPIDDWEKEVSMRIIGRVEDVGIAHRFFSSIGTS